jgi:hypothetical protein
VKRRKFLLGSSAVFASGGFLTGTRAFSSAEVERSVQIEVVGDQNAYLGLTEDQMDEGGVLFGAEMPRIESESFNVINQSTSQVSITIELSHGNLRFTAPGEKIGENEDTIEVEGLKPGEDLTGVTVGLPKELNGSTGIGDILSFEVDGDGLHIEAERTLQLKPRELEVDVSLSNINAPIKIPNLKNPNVQTVTVDGKEVTTITDGSNTNIQFDDSSDLGCSSPSDTISVTVSGTTANGRPFSGTATDVKCSNGNSGSGPPTGSDSSAD